MTLANYSLVSFIQLPQQLGISHNVACRGCVQLTSTIPPTSSPSPLLVCGASTASTSIEKRDFEPMDLPTGSPALFVPGNSGSYGQVRSVASSAARQFYKENGSGTQRGMERCSPVSLTRTGGPSTSTRTFRHFSGSTLIEQATFINEVVAYLTNRYSSPATRNFAAGERNTTFYPGSQHGRHRSSSCHAPAPITVSARSIRLSRSARRTPILQCLSIAV